MISWPAPIDWRTPAGQTLHELMEALPQIREWGITLFGSSPLQLAIEPTFASADVDLESEAIG